DLGSMHTLTNCCRAAYRSSRPTRHPARRETAPGFSEGDRDMTFLVRAEEVTGGTGGASRARRREQPTVALERAVLASLSEGPSHGYVILTLARLAAHHAAHFLRVLSYLEISPDAGPGGTVPKSAEIVLTASSRSAAATRSAPLVTS